MSEDAVASYGTDAPAGYAAVCRVLHSEIARALPEAGARIWHAMPVWFVGANPVVGYKVSAQHVNLLFWNGQSFGDTTLEAAGKFKAAQIKLTDPAQLDLKSLRRWLTQAGTDIWDYQGLRHRA